MRPWRSMIGLALSALTAACATSAPEPVVRDFSAVPGSPAPPHADLYADCVAEAISARRYDRVSDPETELIRFTCVGAPAAAMFDALEAWSLSEDSRFAFEGRDYRATGRIQRNLFGADVCSRGPRGDARCQISLNAGPFLTAP